MSVYTIQIRSLVENGYKIFDFDYPIFDENYRGVLEKKILDRYYFREIGFETPAMFKHYLHTRMNEIMPYYNQLYKSEGIMNKEGFNPLYNLDTTETQKRKVTQDTSMNQTGNETTTNTDTGTSKTSNKVKEIFQDTPQSKLSDVNYATNITDNDGSIDQTANNTSNGTSNNTNETEATANTMEEYESRVLGSGGLRYPADIIMEWRKSFLNIDVQILDNLNDLFMGVY